MFRRKFGEGEGEEGEQASDEPDALDTDTFELLRPPPPESTLAISWRLESHPRPPVDARMSHAAAFPATELEREQSGAFEESCCDCGCGCCGCLSFGFVLELSLPPVHAWVP